jgi:hypothetical protein
VLHHRSEPGVGVLRPRRARGGDARGGPHAPARTEHRAHGLLRARRARAHARARARRHAPGGGGGARLRRDPRGRRRRVQGVPDDDRQRQHVPALGLQQPPRAQPRLPRTVLGLLGGPRRGRGRGEQLLPQPRRRALDLVLHHQPGRALGAVRARAGRRGAGPHPRAHPRARARGDAPARARGARLRRDPRGRRRRVRRVPDGDPQRQDVPALGHPVSALAQPRLQRVLQELLGRPRRGRGVGGQLLPQPRRRAFHLVLHRRSELEVGVLRPRRGGGFGHARAHARGG